MGSGRSQCSRNGKIRSTAHSQKQSAGALAKDQPTDHGRNSVQCPWKYDTGDTPLLAAARGVHEWLDSGGTRPPIRAALIRFWTRQKILRVAVPLTAAAALRAETSFELSAWLPAFLRALATEAADGRQLLRDLERAWFAARSAVAGRRRGSHAAAAVDVLAAVPLVSATSLAAGLGMAVKNAIRLLDGLVAAGVAVEVTRRSKRRLFGLKGMAPLGDAVRPPYRPEPGRGRGRPPILPVEVGVADAPLPLPSAPLTPIDRRQFDYSDIERCMAQMDESIRQTRRVLNALAGTVMQHRTADQPVEGDPADSGRTEMAATP
jgi:hypothetical protein